MVGLESCTHAYRKHNIRSRSTQIKQGSNHRPIYLLIYRYTFYVEVKMPMVPIGVLMGLSSFIPNFFRMS